MLNRAVNYRANKAMKTNNKAIRTARRGAVPTLLKEREIAVSFANIKSGLVREYGTAIGGHNDLLRSALNEAEALAWQTAYPHLFFPVLAQEKASAVTTWAARQRRVQRASREIAMAV